MKRTSRPKWAKHLTAKEWRSLQECQNTKRPTLSALKVDVEYQESQGMTCWTCKHALRLATEPEGTR